MASRSVNIYSPLMRRTSLPVSFKASLIIGRRQEGARIALARSIVCSAAQDSSAATTVVESEEAKPAAKPAAPSAAKQAPAKPKKAPPKTLPEMMEEEVIPSLRSSFEAQEDISEIELSFEENRLEGSFLKNGFPYCFWAFFPDGTLTGSKGFSLSSYGSGPSTVEPFLVDEKRITGKQVAFWVTKRLSAQGIIPLPVDSEE